MKNVSFVHLAGIFLMSVCLAAEGQDAINKNQLLNTAVRVNRNDINVNAVRHFVRNYKDIANENWYATQYMVVALFALQGIDYRIDYNIKNGDWIETFRTYNESKMSSDLKQNVKSAYNDYTIYQVQEIEQPLHPLNYIVHLEGKARLINLRIYDGKMEEEQNFKRAQ